MVVISCSLKNQFRCYPYTKKTKYHKHLISAIIDANLAMKPNFSVVDGVIFESGVHDIDLLV